MPSKFNLRRFYEKKMFCRFVHVFFSRLEIMRILARKNIAKNAMSISQNVELDADIKVNGILLS
jgi:hypothetical protein